MCVCVRVGQSVTAVGQQRQISPLFPFLSNHFLSSSFLLVSSAAADTAIATAAAAAVVVATVRDCGGSAPLPFVYSLFLFFIFVSFRII